MSKANTFRYYIVSNCL